MTAEITARKLGRIKSKICSFVSRFIDILLLSAVKAVFQWYGLFEYHPTFIKQFLYPHPSWYFRYILSIEIWSNLLIFGRKKTLRHDNQSGNSLPPVDTNVKTHHEVHGNACYSKIGRLPPSILCIYVHNIVSFQSFYRFGNSKPCNHKNSSFYISVSFYKN